MVCVFRMLNCYNLAVTMISMMSWIWQGRGTAFHPLAVLCCLVFVEVLVLVDLLVIRALFRILTASRKPRKMKMDLQCWRQLKI